jgi:hypothetical protein
VNRQIGGPSRHHDKALPDVWRRIEHSSSDRPPGLPEWRRSLAQARTKSDHQRPSLSHTGTGAAVFRAMAWFVPGSHEGGGSMNRRVGALLVVLGAASLLVSCGSGGPVSPTASAVPASLQASLGTSPTPPPATATSVPVTPTSPTATSSPSPTPFPVTTYVPAPQPSVAMYAPGAPSIPTNTRLD